MPGPGATPAAQRALARLDELFAEGATEDSSQAIPGGTRRPVTEVVLDASVVLKWFHPAGERHLDRARSLRTRFEAGEIAVIAPPLLRLEILNVAGRRRRWDEAALVELALALDELGFEFEEPEPARVAAWTAAGLTAYDSAYLALAEERLVPLITDDDLIVSLAGAVATALADAGR